MRRAWFSLRRRTSISQKLSELRRGSCEVSKVRYVVIALQKAVPFQFGQIGNGEQTAVYLDMALALTMHQKGSRQVILRLTGNEKTRLTVVLSCTPDGCKLPSYVLFKQKTLKGEKFPKKCRRPLSEGVDGRIASA